MTAVPHLTLSVPDFLPETEKQPEIKDMKCNDKETLNILISNENNNSKSVVDFSLGNVYFSGHQQKYVNTLIF